MGTLKVKDKWNYPFMGTLRVKNKLSYPFSDPLVLGQCHHGLDVLVRQAVGRQLVVLLLDVVRLNHCGKHGEPIGCVQRAIIVVVVDSRQLLKNGFSKTL